jgi:hypothetical protein
MKLRIHPDNAAKIEAALAFENRRSTAHTYTSYHEIEALANRAERQLEDKLLKKDQAGVRYLANSGTRVPSSYRFPRQATSVELTRGPRAWFLTKVSSYSLWEQAGAAHFLVTPKHRAAHLALMSSQFWTVSEPAGRSQEVPA